jgi:DNA repair protein RecN (Recombination protein N)
MLTHLQIRDLAIVDAAELEWSGGFTVLTGETGAGKSILVDALMLATGGRADSTSIRHGAERAEVSATFDLARNVAARAWLDEQSIEHDGECVLRRVVTADGRGRAYINGQTVPAQSLRALGELLVEVHGQLEFQSLVRKSRQRETLDASGNLDADVARVAEACRNWRTLDVERREFETRLRDRDTRLDLLEHYVAELAALDAKPGEAEALLAERTRVAAGARLAEGSARVSELLDAEDDGAIATLARAQSVLRGLLSLDATLAETESALGEAQIACREAAAALNRYLEHLEADPARQEWLESRLAAMETLARKHRCQPADLPALHESLQAELRQLRNIAESRADLDARLEALHREYAARAAELTRSRRTYATELDRRVGSLLAELGMGGGQFVTRVEPHDPVELGESGNDDVEFLVSANPGQPPRPLARVASGGELSRISLALQVATLQGGHVPCLVFDEVDAGVGGAVAERVGHLLAELATRAQVLCVTHLPQVAAQAEHQVRVTKHSDRGRTRTLLENLDDAARVEEIARMLGGATLTARTREHAREMLESGRGADGAREAASASEAATVSRRRGTGNSRARSGRAKSASGRRA